ncbi:ATP-binding protein [Terasakiella sp.]|uniref:ATP-binding protein n=1 Tax=Terasakiella sp. TaxID=2034861 RepID=UPI003AA98EC9
MRLIPQTMLGRTLVTLIGGILLVQALGGVFYYRDWKNFRESAEHSRLIERMATYVQWMNAASPLQREFLLRTNRPRGMRTWQSTQSAVDDEANWFGVEAFIRSGLSEELGGIDLKRIRVDDDERRPFPPGGGFGQHRMQNNNNVPDDQRPHWGRMMNGHKYNARLMVAVLLDDGTWLNMRIPFERPTPPGFVPFAMPLLFLSLLVALVAFVIMRRANKPLARMAQAAETLGRDVNAPPMKEDGPREVRDAARAFNEMQTRLRRFVQDRTHMLAAISHDLRTPITRMRLRAEFVEDDQQREKMLSDLDEMESMIKATMSFARDDVANEAVSPIDLAALVESFCEDMRETDGDVTYSGMEELPFKGRPVGLKRAVANLVGNALKYAGACEVVLEADQRQVSLTVKDNGPGIPENELEEVFRPFRRVEGSRNKETGGVGLGLAVVRSVAHAHGGTAQLMNRPEGGLEAKIVLPR